MTHAVRLRLLGLVFASAAVLLAGCGGKDEDAMPNRTRDLPFVRLKLKNMNPPSGHPASATATGTSVSGGGQTHKAGPVAAGAEGTSPTDASPSSANAVSVVVTFDGGPTYHGSGTYGTGAIGTVEVDANEPHDAVPGGGVVRVIFADARPMQTFPLSP